MIVCINPPTNLRIIITAGYIIESCLRIVVVTTVAKWVLLRQGAGGGQDLAVGVIGVGGNRIAAGVYQSHDIALQIGYIVIGRAIDLHGVGLAGVVVEEVVGLGGPVGRYLLLQQLPTGIDVAVGNGSLGLQNPVGRLGGNGIFFFLVYHRRQSLIRALPCVHHFVRFCRHRWNRNALLHCAAAAAFHGIC